MKKKILFLGIFVLLIGCGTGGESESISSSFESESEIVSSSNFSESEISSSENVSVNNIILSLVDEVVYPLTYINYKVDFEPSDATNKEFTLSTSTPDILSIDGLNVKTLKMGKGKLKATSVDGNYSSEIEVDVLKPNPYQEVVNLLNAAKNAEMNNSCESYLSYYYDSDFYSTSETIKQYIYSDGLKVSDEINNKTEYKYISDNHLNEFVIDNKNNTLNENTIAIGDSSSAILEEEASLRVSLSSYNDIYGFTSLTESLLLDLNSFYMDEMVMNVNLAKSDVLDSTSCKSVFNIEGTCAYLASSFDEKESKMEVSAEITFDNLNRLESVRIDIEKYLFKDNKIDEETPSISESYEYSLTYGERGLMPLNMEDYYVTSFNIDDSNFEIADDFYMLEVDETKIINVIDELPLLHFKETYSLEIEDETILKKGTSPLEIIGVNSGYTNVTIKSSRGIEKTIAICVSKPSVKSISLSYIPNFVMEGDSFEVSASCYPTSVEDKSYTITLNEGDEEKASITMSEGKYVFTALKEGSVTIIATSNSNPTIKDQKTVNIQKKPDTNSVKEKLCSKTYKATDCELSFSNDGTGSLSLQGGGEYSFSWDLRIDGTYVYIDFSNVTTTKSPDRWYDFKGTRGSYTNNEGSFISLIVYDLDYEENCSIQFA